MDEWIAAWVKQKNARLDELEPLGVEGEIAVWHPLDDIYSAPRIPFRGRARIAAAWSGEELVGYVLRGEGDVASSRDLGDASTDADRFFLVEATHLDRIVDWFNDELDTFEQLGGQKPVETVENADGTRMVVLVSHDGNAVVRGGFTAEGELAAAVIET